GGLLMNALGWQSIFVSLTLFSAACGAAVALWLPETLPADAPRLPLSSTLSRYVALLRDREFMSFALCGGVAMAGMFASIARSPFVFIELSGVSAVIYARLFFYHADVLLRVS